MIPRKSVAPQQMGGRKFNSIWYVTIPIDVDRETYIQNCFRTGTVSLINENAELINKVPVGKLAMSMIEFPKRYGQTGSPVACMNITKKNQLVVVDVYSFKNDISGVREENQFSISRRSDTATVQISGKANKGQLFINVDSDTDEGGEVYLNVSNNSKTGKLKLNIQGDIIVDSEGKVTINNTEEVNINSELIKHNTGSEPMVLGDRLKTLLEDFIQEVSISTTAQGPLLNASKIAAFKAKVVDVLSEKSKLD